MESFDKLRQLLNSFSGKTITDNDVKHALEFLDSIQAYTEKLESELVRNVDVKDFDKTWTPIGSGHFGNVYSSSYIGSKVAIKIFKEESISKIREGKILYLLRHENIVSFRGIGYLSQDEAKALGVIASSKGETMFLVMEFIEQNLLKYVESTKKLERVGLSEEIAWNIGKQIIKALNYLHGLNVAHRDLKPDNILLEVGPKQLVVKVADFGLATDINQINRVPTNDLKMIMSSSSSSSYVSSNTGYSVANVRWGAPEVFRSSNRSGGQEWTLEDYKAADIYCFGNILTFAITGKKPYEKMSSMSIHDRIADTEEILYVPPLPTTLKKSLRSAIEECRREHDKRPTAADLMKNYFGSEQNPFELNPVEKAEYFSCGFMDKTDIFVADSCTDTDASQIGYYQSGIKPSGYDHEDLLCLIEVEDAPYRDRPEGDWPLEEIYFDNIDKFEEQAKNRIIDDNPTVALKGLQLARPGETECQKVKLFFKESNYVHHRAIRDIWLYTLSPEERLVEVPSKSEVHSIFSNTFGLHVSVLTDEGPDKPQKFLFPRRAMRAGMSAPGKYTCGAVESASKPDYKTGSDGKTYVDLVNTAARGLKEEIGLELDGNDLEAICLTTIYLKFDTHEWGLCGFVNLKDDRVRREHRLSAESLRDIFSSGPKDKFEHQTLTFVDFDLKTMVDFVFHNHENFASSAKLVVVKVLQAFYGWQRVQQEFEMKNF